MALKNNSATTTANFEVEDGLDDTAQVNNTTENTTTMNTTTTTEVAIARTSALANPNPTASAIMSANVISGLKDAFRVEFDSLPAIGASQGTFNLKADDTDLGAEVKIQLMSYQSSWVASPNDTKADVELVKYSDDGITSRDGINLLAHVEDLKAQGYSKAKIAHRVVLVGELLESKIPCDNVGELVMVDLPDSGRRAFNSYTLQASYAVAKGRKSAEDAAILTLKAVPEKTRAGEKYTKVAIS